MTLELAYSFAPGLTSYVRLRNAARQVWNGSGFETFADANVANYDIAPTDLGGGLFAVTMPAVPAGRYLWQPFLQEGASPSVFDPGDDEREIEWTGTAIATLASLRSLIISAGVGPRSVTISVRVGTSPVQGAWVSLSEGLNLYQVRTSSGGVAQFQLPDATYGVAITKTGYSFNAATLAVDGNESETYYLTAIVPTPATDPDQTTGFIYLRDGGGTRRGGVEIVVQLVTSGTGSDGWGRENRYATSNSVGLAEITLTKGADYQIKMKGQARWAKQFTVPIDADPTWKMPEFQGPEGQ